MPVKEWTKSIKGADDIELGIPRASPLIYRCAAPEQGRAEGLVFVVPDLGEDPGGEALSGLRAHLAGTYRLLAVSAGYHCLRSRLGDGARLDIGPAEMAALGRLCARHGVALIDPNALVSALAQLPEPYEFEVRVIPPDGDYQNLGLMQALDHFAVLQDIVAGTDNGGFDAGNVLAAGHGYGGYLAHLIAKIAPNTVRAVFDFAGLAEAPASYLWGGRHGGTAPYYYHAGKVRLFPLLASKWTDDKTSPHYFSPARRLVRDTASPHQCQAMRQNARRPCCYRLAWPAGAGEAFIGQKRKQADVLARAGFDVGAREAGGGSLGETAPLVSLRRLFDENYPRLPAAPAPPPVPDHLLGSSIAYLCRDTIYSFEHGSWGCRPNVTPVPPPSPAARLYKFV